MRMRMISCVGPATGQLQSIQRTTTWTGAGYGGSDPPPTASHPGTDAGGTRRPPGGDLDDALPRPGGRERRDSRATESKVGQPGCQRPRIFGFPSCDIATAGTALRPSTPGLRPAHLGNHGILGHYDRGMSASGSGSPPPTARTVQARRAGCLRARHARGRRGVRRAPAHRLAAPLVAAGAAGDRGSRGNAPNLGRLLGGEAGRADAVRMAADFLPHLRPHHRAELDALAAALPTGSRSSSCFVRWGGMHSRPSRGLGCSACCPSQATACCTWPPEGGPRSSPPRGSACGNCSRRRPRTDAPGRAMHTDPGCGPR
jgi:hypothetical protein